MVNLDFVVLKKRLPLDRVRQGIRIVEKRPFLSFFTTLGILLALIVLSHFLNRPEAEPKKTETAKKVTVYQIGTAPKVTLQAKVEKLGVLTVVAQTGGVVSQIYHHEGETISRGTWLIGLASNYQGGNMASLQRHLAQKNYDSTVNNFDLQKDLIAKQREVANKTEENADKLRQISDTSLSETRDQLSFNESLLKDLETNINQLETSQQSAPATQAAQLQQSIATSKQLRSQMLAGVNQLRNAVRSTEYQVNEDNPPAQLANLQKDIALKQLDLQERGLDLSKEVAQLNLRIAQIGESLMFPATPVAGKIERIYVRPGQVVAPGTPLALISGTVQNNTAVIRVPAELARTISRVETSSLSIASNEVQLVPSYVSTEATDGQLYSVTYSIPTEYCNLLTDGQYITVNVPVGYPNTTAALPFVPLDAITQTQNEAILYVVENGKVQNRTVELGSVFGRFVQVKSGLNNGDQVILNRNVIAGDSLEIENAQ